MAIKTNVAYLDQATKEALGDYGSEVVIINKFGENPAVGTSEEDIWLVGGQETLLTAGATMYASCTDNTNGVGQVLSVSGLDENWELQEGLVTLTGYTQAAITKLDGSAASWTRIHRAFQISVTPDPVGDVYFAESDTMSLGVPQTTTKIHGFIDFTDAAQQTEKAMYTIPVGYVGFVTQAYAGVAASGGSNRSVDVFFEIQGLATGATVASPSWYPFRRISEANLNTGGQVYINEKFSAPLGPLTQLTNFHMRSVASASSDVIGGFTLKLYKIDQYTA
jgi:hypothetical protein